VFPTRLEAHGEEFKKLLGTLSGKKLILILRESILRKVLMPVNAHYHNCYELV
jgi:hypothetical protein